MSRRSVSALVGIAVLGLGAVGLVMFGFGCKGVPAATDFIPPTIKGASYVGTSTCIVCHPEAGKDFRMSAHSAFNLTSAEGQKPNGEGCESCHGPGSLHQKSLGRTKMIIPTYRDCVRCHLDKRAQFSLPYHHPVPEGLMDCTNCHNPHSARIPVDSVSKINKLCLNCHPEMRGPYVFPHQAVTEDGCIVCHNPHGSSFPKMLVADTRNLCLRCHYEAHYPYMADANHLDRIPGGCENCHQAVHGSNFDELLHFP
jgi:predicted CXXCH cytochrome family protein